MMAVAMALAWCGHGGLGHRFVSIRVVRTLKRGEFPKWWFAAQKSARREARSFLFTISESENLRDVVMLVFVEAPLLFRRKHRRRGWKHNTRHLYCDYCRNSVTAQTSRPFVRVKTGAMSVLLMSGADYNSLVYNTIPQSSRYPKRA